MKHKCCTAITKDEYNILEGQILPNDTPLEYSKDDWGYARLMRPVKILNNGVIIYQEFTSKEYFLHTITEDEIQ